MGRGEKYPDEVKEKAYARYLSGENVGEIAKKLGIAYSTVNGWIKKMPKDEISDVREKHQKAFCDRANRVIEKGMELLEKRFENAISKEKELLLIIDEIAKSGDDIISDKVKAEIIRKLRELVVYDPKSIAVAIGTVFDRRAKAEERSEENKGGGVVMMPEKKKEE